MQQILKIGKNLHSEDSWSAPKSGIETSGMHTPILHNWAGMCPLTLGKEMFSPHGCLAEASAWKTTPQGLL